MNRAKAWLGQHDTQHQRDADDGAQCGGMQSSDKVLRGGSGSNDYVWRLGSRGEEAELGMARHRLRFITKAGHRQVKEEE